MSYQERKKHDSTEDLKISRHADLEGQVHIPKIGNGYDSPTPHDAASIRSNTSTASTAVEADPTAAPDGGYGWVVCLSCTMINGFTWGVLSSFAVYLSYYLYHDIFPGGSPINYAFIGGLNFAAAMLIAPFIGWLTGCLGLNLTMMLGCVVYAGGFVAASFAKALWQLVLTQGLMVGMGVGMIWQPSIGVLPQWFDRKRSLAQGIASSGAGFAGTIFSFATTPMIEHLGLGWSLRITGLVSFVILMCASSLIRDRNAIIETKKAHPFDMSLLKRYRVLLLLGWSIFSILGYIVLLYSLSSYAVAIGLSQSQGGIVIALQNVGTVLGRPFIGTASDRLGRLTVALFLTAFTSLITFAIWIPASSYGVLIFFGTVSGATIGTFWATIAPLTVEVVGLVELPSSLSLTWVLIALPCLFSQPIAFELRRPGSDKPYLYAQIYAGVCYLIAALFLLELRRVKWGLWSRERHY